MTRWGMWCLVVSICAIAATPATAQLKLVPYVTSGLSVPVQMVADPRTLSITEYTIVQLSCAGAARRRAVPRR